MIPAAFLPAIGRHPRPSAPLPAPSSRDRCAQPCPPQLTSYSEILAGEPAEHCTRFVATSIRGAPQNATIEAPSHAYFLDSLPFLRRSSGSTASRPTSTRKSNSLLGDREPTLTELGIFSVMWSEHCSYKSSRVHLKRLPTRSKLVVTGTGRECGHYRHRRWLGMRLQNRIAQPSFIH